MKPYKDIYMDLEHRERIMRFAVLQKFIQCSIFREDLLLNKNKYLLTVKKLLFGGFYSIKTSFCVETILFSW